MITTEKQVITVQASVKAPVEKVWEHWTNPEHIVNWNNASFDWYTPWANNDLREGGKFVARMEHRKGNAGFDFEGEYTRVEPFRLIEYRMSDGRRVSILFEAGNNETVIRESFEAEEMNSPELQQQGWQAILDNFKRYVEISDKMKLQKFEITIHAPASKVYDIMLSEKYWNEWTTPFDPSSEFRGSWEKGSRVRFIGTGDDGKEQGMVGVIQENIPGRFLCIEHQAVIKDGVELDSGPEVEPWAGAYESYFFIEQGTSTLLKVETDINHEHVEYLSEAWPKALAKLKEICERE